MTVTLDTILSKIQHINDLIEASTTKLTIAPNQMVISSGLSDIDHRLGLIQAGEFRSGNGKIPGDGFTGVRIGYPAFIYGSDEWNIAGVDNDVLQFGLRASDGVAVAGGGAVTMYDGGIKIRRGLAGSRIGFYDNTGATVEHLIYSDADGMQIVSELVGKSLNFFIKLSDTTTPYFRWKEDLVVAGATEFLLTSGTNGGVLRMLDINGYPTVEIWSMSSGITSFNLRNDDIDFTVYGTGTTAPILKIDAGENRYEIGYDHIIPTRDASNKNIYFNEANQDMDFIVETDNSGYGLYMDAGMDRATSFAWDGWANMYHHTWTRTGNFTFTISGDVTIVYRKGTKVKFYDSGYKYGVIESSSYSSPNTTITLITNSDYTMSGDPGARFISHVENPEDWPDYFTFAVSWTSTPTPDPAIGDGILEAFWKAHGHSIIYKVRIIAGSTTTFGNGYWNFSIPVTPARIRSSVSMESAAGNILDTSPGIRYAISSFVRSGDVRGIYANGIITNAVPITWASGDAINMSVEYEF
jgi:hypothetical protein